MEPGSSPVYLTSVVGSFQAKLLAARLAAEGVRTDLRGGGDGPYPLPVEVGVFVRADQLDLANEVLLADAVDAVFAEQPERVRPPRSHQSRRLRRRGER